MDNVLVTLQTACGCLRCVRVDPNPPQVLYVPLEGKYAGQVLHKPREKGVPTRAFRCEAEWHEGSSLYSEDPELSIPAQNLS